MSEDCFPYFYSIYDERRLQMAQQLTLHQVVHLFRVISSWSVIAARQKCFGIMLALDTLVCESSSYTRAYHLCQNIHTHVYLDVCVFLFRLADRREFCLFAIIIYNKIYCIAYAARVLKTNQINFYFGRILPQPRGYSCLSIF